MPLVRIHTWTPETEGGFLNEEFDQILTKVNSLDTSVTTILSDYWRSTNDGAGSGLDADLLDGVQLATLRAEYSPYPWYGAYEFQATGGGSSSGGLGGTVPTILLPNAGSPYADAMVGIPSYLRGKTVKVSWALAKDTASGGNWRLSFYANPISNNAESSVAVGSATTNTHTVPGGQYYTGIYPVSVSTAASDVWLRLRILRDSAHFTDDNLSKCCVMGVFLSE